MWYFNVKYETWNQVFQNATLTLVGTDSDVTGTYGELNYLLSSKGFNVVSYSTAKNAIRYKNQIQGTNIVNKSIDAEVYSIKELNSIYALEIDYTYYYDFTIMYRNFSAKVTDLNTSEIVMSANFRGNRSVQSVLKEFVNQLAAKTQ